MHVLSGRNTQIQRWSKIGLNLHGYTYEMRHVGLMRGVHRGVGDSVRVVAIRMF